MSLKSEIIKMIPVNQSINVADLVMKLNYPFVEIEKAIQDLVDDEIFDLAEGRDKLKIFKKYVYVIRRQITVTGQKLQKPNLGGGF